jgi:hypothetical protein
MTTPTKDKTKMQPVDASRMWIRPEVTTLSAGAAELAVGKLDDGVDKS